MICEHCHHQEATVHIQEIAGGKKVSHHFCAECALAKGLVPDHDNTLSLASALLKMVKADLSEVGAPDDAVEAPETASLDDLTCPACGLRGAEFRKLGRFGCAHCYDTFASALAPLLGTLHRGVRHAGKSPAGAATAPPPPAPPSPTATIPPPPPPSPAELAAALEEELRCAVVDENYERAAQLRDQLHALRTPAATHQDK